MIALSEYHRIELAKGYQPLLDRPPQRDHVIRTVARKLIHGQPLVSGELVISGCETLEKYPRARLFPVHFRKTFYPGCFHKDPRFEYESHVKAAEIIALPPPIGFARKSFRSCFIQGTPFDRLSPFGIEPPEGNIAVAETANPARLIGLWNLMETIYGQVNQLHRNGLAHGDLFLHNVIVSLSPIGVYLIDFEQSLGEDACESPEKWGQIRREDFASILREAVFVQCGLGRQEGPLANAALKALPDLFRSERTFRAAIERKSHHG